MKDTIDAATPSPAPEDTFTNRKLIRPTLAREQARAAEDCSTARSISIGCS